MLTVLVAAMVFVSRWSDRPKSFARTATSLTREDEPPARPAQVAREDEPVRASRPVSRPHPVTDLSCPWVAQSRAHTRSPAALAAEVLSRMTLQQKIGFVALAQDPPIESANRGVPSLCIPPLTLTDGPDGIAYDTKGVIQLPTAIGLAATFNPAVTYATGQVAGAEARARGLDVLQGPELNLARVPQSGRTFEAYGEDPDLTAAMGVANVEGIQSQGVMAEAKHFTVYNQETARVVLNQAVTDRALAEIYDVPFEAVIQQAHVASLMCSYGQINGTNVCSDPSLFGLLRSWGFNGFVRSDLGAVRNPAPAIDAGLDLLKPASVPVLTELVHAGAIPIADLDAAVTYTLAAMFAFNLIASPHPPAATAEASPAVDAQTALSAAESSMVLLKNHGNVLPLSPGTRSVAVIGSDASTQALTTGRGSSQVRSSGLVPPSAPSSPPSVQTSTSPIPRPTPHSWAFPLFPPPTSPAPPFRRRHRSPTGAAAGTSRGGPDPARETREICAWPLPRI